MDITSLIQAQETMMGNPMLIPMIIGLGLQAIGTGVGIAQGSKQKKQAQQFQKVGQERLQAGLTGMRATIDRQRTSYNNIFKMIYGYDSPGAGSFDTKGFSFNQVSPFADTGITGREKQQQQAKNVDLDDFSGVNNRQTMRG